MLRLQMLPAACGDCLWLEYGTPPATRLVIIDGGLRATAAALRQRLERARRERGVDVLEVELLVVTHIDNDHILGVIELLENAPPWLSIKDIWFNGRRQLRRLPAPPPAGSQPRKADGRRPRDLMGGSDDEASAVDEDPRASNALASPEDLLGPQQGDDLSKLLEDRRLPWNEHPTWRGEAVLVPDTGALPVVTLAGGLKLTLLSPTLDRLYRLCAAWASVLSGKDEPAAPGAGPRDLLGRRDTWPPVWKDGEGRDPSAANGSSIALLAEYPSTRDPKVMHTLLLAGDAHAPDMLDGLERLRVERNIQGPVSLAAFKLSHHGSDKNLTRALLEGIDCSRYIVSTDGTVHCHPDHQAMLRILRYSRAVPELVFNCEADTTRPWRDRKSDVLDSGSVGVALRNYSTRYPDDPPEGIVLELD